MHAETNAVSTNFISIHLGAKPGTTNVFGFGAGKFDAMPVLADADFVSFNVETRKFTVTGPAALRLSNAIYHRRDFTPTILNGGVQELIAFPTPFVLKAEGQPIYAGMFYTLVSSQSYPGPLVIASPDFVSTNQIAPIEFDEFYFMEGKSAPGKANTPGDPRIGKAVSKLLKSRGM